LAFAAWTFNTSFSSNISGLVNNSVVVFEDIVLVVNKLNTFELASVNVTVMVDPDPAYSETKIDRITD
jgi:hypothetical protein